MVSQSCVRYDTSFNRRSWRWGWVEIAAAPADLPGSSCCVPEKNVKGTQDELRDDLPILL